MIIEDFLCAVMEDEVNGIMYEDMFEAAEIWGIELDNTVVDNINKFLEDFDWDDDVNKIFSETDKYKLRFINFGNSLGFSAEFRIEVK